MTRNTRLQNIAVTGLAIVGLALAAAGLTSCAPPKEAAPPAAAQAVEQRKPVEAKKPDYSPYPDRKFPDRVYWGVAHVHTGYSFDSGMFGVTTTPEDLFRVARGGEVVLDNGQRFKQDRPLDWVAITDHAEYMGISDQIRAGSPELLANPTGKRWYDMSQTSPQEGVKAAIEAVISMQSGKPVFDASKLTAAAWTHATAAAEKWNQPGVFTALHGFEWTSAPGGNNLHRTVVFRDGADQVNQVVPYSTFDSQDPADLWKYMDAYEKKTGGQVLAIPHNGNLSNGMMYSAETFDGKPMDLAYAQARASHEPLLEATQIKGDGETNAALSPNDEFANFERWWDVNVQKMEPVENSVLGANYVRSALELGLALDAKLGANPFKAGLIGGNDAHIGVVTTREDNFFGEFANGLPSPERWKTPLMMVNNDPKKGPLVSVWGEQAAGLGGVWARENTREAIWDALERKEVYATTGDRPVVRVFAGWDFAQADLDRADFAENGYAHGVPMGGDLSAGTRRQAARLPGPRDARPGRTQPRSRADHQRLARQGREGARTHLRRRRVRRPQDRSGWPLQDAGRQHRGRAERQLHEQHRRRGARGVLEGPGVRCVGARLLLRPRDPNPVAALDGLRSEAVRHQDARLRADDGHRPGLHVAYLVFTGEVMARVLKEPLLHFLLLGGGLFLAFSLLPGSVGTGEQGKIVITQGQLTSMMESFTRARQRPPTPEEWEGLIRARVREEVYYREALALGLDKDDSIIRRRLQQKMEFVSDDIAAQAAPTDAELNAYLLAHPDTFRAEPRVSFRHVYLNPEKRGMSLSHDATQLLALLNRAGGTTNFSALGDAVMLAHEFDALPAGEVRRLFGGAFAATLDGLSPGRWQGPVQSAYGLHLVFVSQRLEARLPSLADARDDVLREWQEARRVEANERFYQALLTRYTVTVERQVQVEARNLSSSK